MKYATIRGMKLVIHGQIPSLKNAKKISVNSRTGKRFVRTEARVKDFMDKAKQEISLQWSAVKTPVCVTYVFYNKDLRKHDIENQVATLNDCLKEFLGDDDQMHIAEVVGRYAGVDRICPRAEIWIDET